MPRKNILSKKLQVILPDEQLDWLQDMILNGDAENMSQAIRLAIKKEMKRNEDE